MKTSILYKKTAYGSVKIVKKDINVMKIKKLSANKTIFIEWNMS